MNKFFLFFFFLLLIVVVGCNQSAPEEKVATNFEQDMKNHKSVVARATEEVSSGMDKKTDSTRPLKELEIQQAEQESNVKEISIIAKKWVFDPEIVEVNQGDAVKLKVTSVDVTHGILIPAFGVNEDLVSGEEVNIEFVADKKGTFPFICSVFCGSGHNSMKGTLIVR